MFLNKLYYEINHFFFPLQYGEKGCFRRQPLKRSLSKAETNGALDYNDKVEYISASGSQGVEETSLCDHSCKSNENKEDDSGWLTETYKVINDCPINVRFSL